MPRELIAVSPRHPELREYREPDLGPTQVRIRTELASPKHGTELVAYRNDPVASRPYDPGWGAVMPRPPEEALASFPRRLGNMAVGVVTETGPDVSRFRAGGRVFGHFAIRETQTVDESHADLLPEGISPEAALCLDPVVMALAARDAGIKLGDKVAVFGLGAIGLFTVQLARLAGASQVIAVDPLANRRELATVFGADVVLDPAERDADAGLTIRRLTRDETVSYQPEAAARILGGYYEVPPMTYISPHNTYDERSYGGVSVTVNHYGGGVSEFDQMVEARLVPALTKALDDRARGYGGMH